MKNLVVAALAFFCWTSVSAAGPFSDPYPLDPGVSCSMRVAFPVCSGESSGGGA